MRFLDEIRKIVSPYEDEDDFFEGANEQFRPQPAAQPQQPVSQEQALFERNFGEEAAHTEAAPPAKKPAAKAPKAPKPELQPQAAPAGSDGSIFGNLGGKKPVKRERTVNFGGRDSQVILFNPKTFDEAGEVVSHILQNRSVVMSLEGILA